MNFLASLAGTAQPTTSSSNNPFDSFNTNLERLLKVLTKHYPTEPDLQHYQSKLEAVLRANYKLPASLFVKIVESHTDFIEPIMKKDDQYFLKDLQYEHLVENPKYLALIQKVIHLWTNSEQPELKKEIARFMILLLCNSVKATKNQFLLDIINHYRQKPLIL